VSAFGISVRCERCRADLFFVGVRQLDTSAPQRHTQRFPCPRCGAGNRREIVGTVEPGSLSARARD
jgi:hypothetical protein